MKRAALYFRLLRWFSIRQMRRYPWRVITVVIGIALGAGVFTGVRIAVDASLDSYENSMDQVSGKADWVVRRPGDRLPETLVRVLLLQEKVEAVSPLIMNYVEEKDGKGGPFLLIGVDPILDRTFHSWQIGSPRPGESEMWMELIRTPGAMVMSRPLADKLGVSPGGRVTLLHASRIASLQVVGLLEPIGLARVDGGRMAVTDIASMQEFSGLQGLVDRIDLKLKSPYFARDLEELRASLPPGVVLEPPTVLKETGQGMIRAYQLNLSILSFVSLFVGMFLVYNLIALHAASRRREVAVLRSLGASSRLVFLLFLSEGALLGLAGWVVSIPVGSALVGHMVEAVSRTVSDLFAPVHVDGFQANGWEIALSFLVTLLISLAAAYGPAREAQNIPPREALLMQGVTDQKGEGSHRHSTLLGLVLILVTWPLAQLPSLSGLPLAGYFAVFTLFSGFSLLSPLLLNLIGSHVSRPLRRLGGEPAFLGARTLRDSGKRTAVSVGALITAMALFVSLVITVQSFRHTVELWIDQTLSGDLFLRPGLSGMNDYRDTLPPEVVDSLKKISGEGEVLPYRRIHLNFGTIPYQLEATDLGRFLKHGGFILMDGDSKEVSRVLTTGHGVLVSEVFSNATGLKTGDRYRVRLGEALLDLPILGVCRDYRTRGGVVFMSFDLFQRLTGDGRWSGARFFLPPGTPPSVTEDIQARIHRSFEGKYPVETASGRELRTEVLRIFDQTFAITTVLLLIALLVAGLGITTTLTVMVLERVRELGTLFAVGAGAGQIRAMITWEALLMVTVGEVVGLGCGFLLSHLLIHVINKQSFGWTFLFHVNWSDLILSYPLILITALAAALPASRLALRLPPAIILKEQ